MPLRRRLVAETSRPLDGYVPRSQGEVARYRELGVYSGKTLVTLLDEGATQHPFRTAVVDGPVRVTYAELRARVAAKAQALERRGLGRRDRVVLHLPNSLAFLENFFALQRLGCIPVMALPGHRAAELSYFVEHTGAVAYVGALGQSGLDQSFLNAALGPRLAEPAQMIWEPGGATAEQTAGSEATHTAEPLRAPASPVDPNDVALLQLSGGSTGTPKLIARTHEEYLYSVVESARITGLSAESVYLAALPIAHNFPLSSPGILGCLYAGGTVVLTDNPSPDRAFPLLSGERITITALVPSLARIWLDAMLARRATFPHLRVLQVGGARLDETLARRWMASFGGTLQQVFGMAEGLVNYTRLEDSPDIIATTQGRPMSQYDEVRVVDDDDRDVASGSEGQLLTRGPYTIVGYYRAEAHNRCTFTADGFYRTGDIVRQTASGHLVVTGRAKEQINRGGEKIAPAEVEAMLTSHARIAEAAVLGVPDELLGERIVAFLVTRGEEKLRSPEVLAYLRGRGLATFKMPDRIVFVNDLPKTHVGKIDKPALLAQLP